MSILILGDLGAGDSRAAVGWQRQLARLQQHASPMLNLSPTFSSPDGKLFCGSFRPNPFNDYFHLPRHPGSTGFAMSEPSQEVIDNILTWLAPLPLVDAGLLRRLRVEMQWGNSALEAVIWNHSSVRDIGLGICLHQQVNPTAAQTKQRWQIVQTGAQGQIKCEPQSEEADVLRPVAEFDVSQGFPPRLTLTASAEQATWMLHNGLTVALPENGTAIIEAGALKLELEAIRRPSWASQIRRDAVGLWAGIFWLNQDYDVCWQVSKTEANGFWRWPTPFGEDSFGLYADLSVNNVTQRFRWIEPGTFWMGSPEDEPEREWDGLEEAKGTETLHPVTLTQDFWLADTAVTQTFRQGVMGNNPRDFTGNPENPVEVERDHTQVFIDRLNYLFPGLQAKLPSKAQWEFACRAGTAMPFSFGANITPGTGQLCWLLSLRGWRKGFG